MPKKRVTIAGAPTGSSFQEWADQSRVPVLGGTVTVRQDSPQGASAKPKKRLVHWYPGDTSNTDAWAPGRALFLHELGHVYEGQMGAKRRDAFRQILGVKAKQHWNGGADSLEELFAQGYSLAAQGAKQMNAISKGYGYNPTKRQQHQVRRLILGKRVGSKRDPIFQPK